MEIFISDLKCKIKEMQTEKEWIRSFKTPTHEQEVKLNAIQQIRINWHQ